MIIDEISEFGETKFETRAYLASKVFNKTANYDLAIANYFNNKFDFTPEKLTLTYKLEDELRYGENPHQKAVYYTNDEVCSYKLQDCEQLHGKKMSYKSSRCKCSIRYFTEFDETVCVALKHMNPCGVAAGNTV